MLIATVDGCFRCINLRTGSFLIAYTFLFSGVGCLVLNVVAATSKTEDGRDSHIFLALVCGMVLLTSFLLLCGLVTYNPKLLRTWLQIFSIVAVLNAGATPTAIIAFLDWTTSNSLFALSLCVFGIVFQIYCIIVVYSYYRSLVEQQQQQQEVGVFPAATLPISPVVDTASRLPIKERM